MYKTMLLFLFLFNASTCLAHTIIYVDRHTAGKTYIEIGVGVSRPDAIKVLRVENTRTARDFSEKDIIAEAKSGWYAYSGGDFGVHFGKAGYSLGQKTKEDAVKKAMAGCVKAGGDTCEYVFYALDNGQEHTLWNCEGYYEKGKFNKNWKSCNCPKQFESK